jgi:small subunit ribosomal protein S5
MSDYKVDTSNKQPKELVDKLVDVMRTTKVVKGGRIFGFTALVVIGDGSGRVGFGIGKSREVPTAIQKATEQGRASMKHYNMHGTTLQHEIIGRHGSTKVWMKPASDGTGIIAGSAMRAIFEVMGVENILAKCVGRSSNKFNVVQATFAALNSMVDPRATAAKRGKTVRGIYEVEND